MVIAHPLVFLLAFLHHSIDLSSQFDGSLHGEPGPSVPQHESNPASVKDLAPDKSNPSMSPDSPARQAAPAHSSFHVRSSSPSYRSRSPETRFITSPIKIDSSSGSQYKLDQLEFIRITSSWNSRRVFELRKYTFPADKLIFLRVGHNSYMRMPTKEQIVLSTADGWIFAILETPSFLAGIYSSAGSRDGRRRVKTNMETGEIIRLVRGEVDQIPVGRTGRITRRYIVELVGENPADQ